MSYRTVTSETVFGDEVDGEEMDEECIEDPSVRKGDEGRKEKLGASDKT